MQLHRFLGHQPRDPAQGDLAGLQMPVAQGCIRIQMAREIGDGGPRLFDLDRQVGGAMRQGLERDQRLAELLAGAQIVQRQIDRRAQRAQGIGRMGQDAARQHRVEIRQRPKPRGGGGV